MLVTNSRLEVTLPDSSKYPMIRKDADTYVDELNGYTLTKTDSDYVFDDGQYKYYFNINTVQSVAYLSAIEDYSGNRLNLSRTANTEEISISDGAGRSFALSDLRAVEAPDSSGVNYYSQKEITDPNGNKLEYTTKFDRYIQVKDQAGVMLGSYEYKSPVDYTLVKSTDKTLSYYDNGRLKQITYANGSWVKYTYDDANMMYTTLTSADETTKTVYNDAFLPVEYTDEYGTVTSYTYDEYYRVKTEKTGDETTAYNYDDKGNILSYITGNAENDTYYTYDTKGNVIREQNGNSYTYYTYDNNKNILVNAALKEDYEGEAPSVYDSALTCFDKTEYTYDDKGRVTKEENSEGTVYLYEYDNSGNVLKETNTYTENGETKTTVTSYTYDDLGNLLTTACDKDTASYIYDKAGRTLLANENGKCTRTVYDEYARVIQEIAPEDYDASKDGLPAENTYADPNVGARYYFAENGNLAKEINRLDVATYYTYFENSSTVKTETFDLYKYEYKQNGDVQNVYIGGKTNADGSYTGGNLYAQYNYNEDTDCLESVEYGNGQSISYTYNSFGQVLTQSHKESESAPEEVQFAYQYTDAEKEEDSKLLAKYDYNIGQKTVYNNDVVEIYNLSFDENGEEVLEPYYSYENIEAKEEEDGTKTNAKLIESFGSKVITSEQTETADVFSKDNEELFRYNYNVENDNLVSTNIVDKNGTKILDTTYSYNEKGYVEEMTTVTSEDVIMKTTYAYDEQGRITEYYSAVRCKGNWESINFANQIICVYYTYDTKGQLIREDIEEDETKVYTYDKRGNLTKIERYDYTRDEITGSAEDTEKVDLEYENTAWLDEINSVAEMPALYDSAGNPVELMDCEFSWTNGRQLKSITDKSTGEVLVSYSYDENGIRTSKTVGNETTYFTTIDGKITSQYTIDENGEKTLEMNFIYNSSDEVVGATCDGRTYYYVKNALGDVIGIVTESGKMICQYEYNAWGIPEKYINRSTNSWAQSFAWKNPMLYRGYYYDVEIGFYYLQSRYYLAYISRFINSDLPEYAQAHKGYHAGTNLFAYCLNNPILLKDYDGKDPLIYVYIFYDLDDFSTQAKHEKKYWEDSLVYSIVKIIKVKNKNEFINKWNNTIKKNSIVSMIYHGSPHGIRITNDRFGEKDVKRLKNKQISQLRILACNCGHKDVKNNIAKLLKKHLTKTKVIYAMDGNISYYPRSHYFEYKYYKPRLSTNQHEYNKYASAVSYTDYMNRTRCSLRKPTGLYKV